MLSISIAIGFLSWFVLSSIKNNAKELSSLKDKNFYFSEQFNKNIEFNDNKEKYEKDFEKINQMLVNYKDPIDFIKFLESVAQSLNLEIDISFLPSNNKVVNNNWNTLSFQIACLGSFNNNLSFLNKLENSSYLIAVENIKVNKITETDEKLKNKQAIKLTSVIKVFAK